MTLEEAIQIQEMKEAQQRRLGYIPQANATQLGIEALKRERQWRLSPRCTSYDLLPGEAEE